MEFKHSTKWNSSIPPHRIQVFHYMEFKYSTTWNLNWLNGFENFLHMKFMVPFTTNLKLTMDLTDFQYQLLDLYLFSFIQLDLFQNMKFKSWFHIPLLTCPSSAQ